MLDRKKVLELRAVVENLCDKIKEIGGDTFSVRTSKDYLWIDVDDANGNRILDYDETIKITKKEEQNG